MTKIILDRPTIERLVGSSTPVTVCDETGRVRGRFIPEADEDLYRNVQIPHTEEELDRAFREPGGRTLAEIMRDLEKQ